MRTKFYRNDELANFRSMEKRVTNPGARWLEKPKGRPAHRQRSFHVVGRDDDARFSIYQRQNLTDEQDFSCEIAYLPPGGPLLTLARYNGPSHVHGTIAYRSHIHQTSENALLTGKKPESEAEETNRFTTLEGALACLIQDFNLSGLTPGLDDPERWS